MKMNIFELSKEPSLSSDLRRTPQKVAPTAYNQSTTMKNNNLRKDSDKLIFSIDSVDF